MRGATLLLLPALAVVLAGCPLPQALPEYSATAVTPPRILAEEVSFADSPIILVPAGCPTTEPSYPLRASIVDSNTLETVEARWFVNYDWRNPAWNRIWDRSFIAPNADTTQLTRAVPPFTFRPYLAPPPFGTPALVGPPYAAADVVRVVELVVSNGFDPSVVGTEVVGANRAPKLPSFATQVFRWVFLTSSSVPCSPAAP